MVLKYKLTDENGQTYGGTSWVVGRTNAIPVFDQHPVLCTSGVFHAYHDPLVAVLVNPIHADIRNPRMFQVECSEIVVDDRLKCGTYKMRPVRELDVPRPTVQ